ncbi:hypothetical protein, partial [Phragmitibacter flavus]|uniref:hypothetical protein n=1 Tax=Phragmitibacter flavus TaxID=2576071 RepID=UPI0019802A8E
HPSFQEESAAAPPTHPRPKFAVASANIASSMHTSTFRYMLMGLQPVAVTGILPVIPNVSPPPTLPTPQRIKIIVIISFTESAQHTNTCIFV